MMPTSLTLDTARSDDGMLMLIAAGEIDLSNIDESPSPHHGHGQRRQGRWKAYGRSVRWSTWTAPPSTPCSAEPTTFSSSPARC